MDSSKLMLTALRFNEKINLQDPEGLAELMTHDHMFIDAEGNVTKGKNVMKEGWRQFFKQYPDYRNKFTSITVQDNIVVMVGYSTCSFKQLEGPNIWTARIRGNRVSEWKVSWLNKR
jgi:ketosteroid isomerase-like protein